MRGSRAATGSTALLVALTIVSGTQRFSMASVPPLTSQIMAQTGLSALALGLATTVTVIVMALGAPLAAGLTHRISREWLLAIGAALVVAGCAVRAVPPLEVTLFLGSVLGGLGIAAVSTMVPGVIAERLPGRVGIAVSATTFALTFIAVVVSSLTAPLAAQIGVAGAMAAWAIPAAVAMAIWLPFTRGSVRTPGGRVRMPWRSGTAWLLTFLTIGQWIVFLLALAWVSPSFQQQGLGADAAGLMLGAVTLGNMLGAMLSPLMTRGVGGDRRPILLLALVLTVVGGAYLALGFTVVPAVAMVLLGLGLGGAFGVVLALLIDLGDSPRATAALSAMSFLVGNLVSAPIVALGGWLRDATGGFTLMWWIVVAVSLAQIPLARALGPSRRGSVSVPR